MQEKPQRVQELEEWLLLSIVFFSAAMWVFVLVRLLTD